jgi:hypothetical protein
MRVFAYICSSPVLELSPVIGVRSVGLKRAEVVWSLIDVAFAQPITRNDDTGDYAATQIIAELFKSAGFGGIAYKSNYGKEALLNFEWVNFARRGGRFDPTARG